MLGLFKPPRFHIQKRIPVHALVAYHAVEAYVQTALSDLDKQKLEFATAYVVSVWACNGAMARDIQLSDLDYRYVQNAGINSAKMLTENLRARVANATRELKQNGIIKS